MRFGPAATRRPATINLEPANHPDTAARLKTSHAFPSRWPYNDDVDVEDSRFEIAEVPPSRHGQTHRTAGSVPRRVVWHRIGYKLTDEADTIQLAQRGWPAGWC
jgi:hypothetical protein